MKSNTIQRPLSPHLTIYQPQLTSVLSIIHRGTGVMLSAFYIGYFAWEDRDAAYPFSYNTFARTSTRDGLVLFRQLLIFAGRSYHFFNGRRHFLWDSGLFLDLKSVYATGWTVVGCTVALTTLFYTLNDGSTPPHRYLDPWWW